MTGTPTRGRGVHPLGAYVAKRCPVRLQWDTRHPCDPEPEIVNELRTSRGIDFEEHITEHALATEPAGWVRIDRGDRTRDEIAADTLDAMRDGALVIFDGRLPIDHNGLRVGEPDALVRYGTAPIDGSWRYMPVDVKHHSTLTEPDTTKPTPTVEVSTLDAPFFEQRVEDPEARIYRLKQARDTVEGDCLQLAHYARILDTLGHMAPVWHGGIIGKEELVVWYDLNKPLFTTRSTSDPDITRKTRTALERYDHEFGFRVDIMHAAAQANSVDDPSLLVEPLKCSECAGCPWRNHCLPQLEAGTGHVTLLPYVGYNRWRTLTDHHIHDRQSLVDVIGSQAPHLYAVFEQPSLSKLVAKAQEADPDAEIGGLIRSNAHKQAAALVNADIATAGQLVELFAKRPITAKSDSWLRDVTNAQAALSPEPFLAWPHRTPQAPPRFDVEVDIDMENTIDDHVYLWGGLVHNRDASDSVYRSFVNWDTTNRDTEIHVFESFWAWFQKLRTETVAAGRTFGAYCWHKGAEERRLTELAAHDPTLTAQVAEFIDSDQWIDLLDTWKHSYTTGTGNSLKNIAHVAGFEWRVDQPDGEASMTHYETQRLTPTSPEAGDARAWLLSYNEDDCRATHHIRNWLTQLTATPAAA